jgi:DNA-binding NtrC family response regulator
VIDDEPGVLASVRHLLRQKRPELVVEGTTSVQEALQWLANRHYDVVISDIKMPEMSGIAMMRRARAVRPNLPVIFITAYGQEYADDVLKLGAFGVLDKPLNSQLLLEALQLALQSSTGQNPTPPTSNA